MKLIQRILRFWTICQKCESPAEFMDMPHPWICQECGFINEN